MASTVQTLLINYTPDDLLSTQGFFQREAPHIALAVADSISLAKDTLGMQHFDSVLVNHAPPDSATLDFLTHLQNQVADVAAIILLPGNDYHLIENLIRNGAAATVIKGPGYWECLPVLIEQAIRHRQAIAIE